MKIGILGSGTWGVAVAIHLAKLGHDVVCYSRSEKEVNSLMKTRSHPFLEKAIIPEGILFTTSIEECVKNAHIVIFAVPSSAIRSVCSDFKPYYKDQLIVCLAKGMEDNTFFSPSEIIEDVLGVNSVVTALTGPTHAEEVSLGLPTCIISACPNLKIANKVGKVFNNEFFRVYTVKDRKGAELSGAFKNIIALACGISDGLGFGDNTKAAIITRGVKELRELGNKLGCSPNTFFGLAGIGDLIVTATSSQSRNHNAGVLLGQGKSMDEAKKAIGMVVESFNALPSMIALINKFNLRSPICRTTYKICYENYDIKEALMNILKNKVKDEFGPKL